MLPDCVHLFCVSLLISMSLYIPSFQNTFEKFYCAFMFVSPSLVSLVSLFSSSMFSSFMIGILDYLHLMLSGGVLL